jgi:mRNA interferase YafQ
MSEQAELQVIASGKFKKSLKRAYKRHLNISELEDVINKLKRRIPLDDKHHDHALSGQWKGFRECHIEPDWLLIYLIEDDVLTLTLVDTGTHADLFDL